jgi:hypothetical protein
MLSRLRLSLEMSSHTADASTKISEFRSDVAKCKHSLKNIRSVLKTLTNEESKKMGSLISKVNLDVAELHEFFGKDVEERKAKNAALPAIEQPVKQKRPSILRRRSSIAFGLASLAEQNISDPRTANAEKIKQNLHEKRWYPSSWAEFYSLPYSSVAGLSNSEWNISGEICPIHPLSLLSQIWFSFVLIWILIYAITAPLGIAYKPYQGWLLPLSLGMSVILFVDTIIQLQKGFIADQELEMRRSEVWSYHMNKKTIFWNVLLGFPYVMISQVLTSVNSTERYLTDVICMVNCLIVIRISKRTTVSWIGERMKIFIQIHEINNTMVTLFIILIGITIYWHWYACAINYLTVLNAVPSVFPNIEQTDTYVLNLFNAGSMMFSSGWAVAAPLETSDRIPKLFNMIISAFLFALFTANITTYMIRLDSSGRQFNEKLEEIMQYVTYRGLGNELQNRIFRYYLFKYSQRKYFDEERILAELNPPLRVVRFSF